MKQFLWIDHATKKPKRIEAPDMPSALAEVMRAKRPFDQTYQHIVARSTWNVNDGGNGDKPAYDIEIVEVDPEFGHGLTVLEKDDAA